MEYIDLKDFESFVVERKLVSERYRSYYLNWVRRFLQSGFAAQELADKDALTCFVDQLERDESVADWQVEQTKRAVELYLNVFQRKPAVRDRRGRGWKLADF